MPEAPHPLRLVTVEPLTLDPALVSDGFSARATRLLFAGLVEQTKTREIVPDIATHWEIENGGCSYVFHLRRDVRWSDGTFLTAHDFEFACKRVLAPTTEAPLASHLYDVKGARAYHQGVHTNGAQVGIRARDRYTLIFELEQPAAYFLHIVAKIGAVPRHIVLKARERWTEPDNIVTSGPFHLDSWEPGKRMELARNEQYHGSYTGNVRRAALHFCTVEEQIQLYESDQLDVISLDVIDYFERGDLIRFLQRNVNDFVSSASLNMRLLNFNLSQRPFSDVLVRRAFALATDRESFLRLPALRYALPATGGFVPPGMPGHTPDLGLPFNPAQARQLLAQAGFPGGRGFPSVTLVRPTWGPQWPAWDRHPRWLAEQWRAHLDVTVDCRLIPYPEYYRYLDEKRPDLRFVSWTADYPDPDSLLRVAWDWFHPTWREEQYSQLVEQARQLTDQSERLALYRRADRILIRNACIVPVTYERDLWLGKPWVTQFSAPIGGYYWKDVIIEQH